MFNEFRDAWRQAVDNFWQELRDDDATPAGVYREVANARNQVERLEAQIGETRQRAAHERDQMVVCRRRERMARSIGDEETARIASDYADRHHERMVVLERKLEALEAERTLCRRDLGEMERALQDGRAAPPPELTDRDRERHRAEGEFRTLEESHRTRTAEERLEELKRRMGR